MLPTVIPGDSNNPTLAIMGVVADIDEDVHEKEVNAPERFADESGDQALAA